MPRPCWCRALQHELLCRTRSRQVQLTHGHAPGFFENKEADAKARGAPAPKKVQAEDYDEFMSSLASDVRDLEAREEAAAEDAAQERADREAFEQR